MTLAASVKSLGAQAEAAKAEGQGTETCPGFGGIFESKLLLMGRNPAPVDRQFIPLFTGFYTSQVVRDFFHQQYLDFDRLTRPGSCLSPYFEA